MMATGRTLKFPMEQLTHLEKERAYDFGNIFIICRYVWHEANGSECGWFNLYALRGV